VSTQPSRGCLRKVERWYPAHAGTSNAQTSSFEGSVSF
jgi:hypothetical protein